MGIETDRSFFHIISPPAAMLKRTNYTINAKASVIYLFIFFMILSILIL